MDHICTRCDKPFLPIKHQNIFMCKECSFASIKKLMKLSSTCETIKALQTSYKRDKNAYPKSTINGDADKLLFNN